MHASALSILLLAGVAATQSRREEAQAKVVSAIDLEALYRTIDPLAMQAAADRGLAWLASQQQEGGGWSADVGHKQQDDYLVLSSVAEQKARGEAHLGVSAFCGLAFLAGGHLPGRGKYGRVVDDTVKYVVAHSIDNGYLRDGETRMYSHAFATLFLAEAYGMTRTADVKTSLERAVRWIVDNQNRYGAWRYNPFTTEADLSVTVCQLQALRAARNIGIEVPHACVEAALAYVLRSRVPSGRMAGLFYYKIYGRGAYSKPSEFAINAAAVTALASAGNYDQELWAPAMDLVDASYPETFHYYADHYYYWYGNYYACQAFFWAGGTRFQAYYQRLAEDILSLQRNDGSWRNRTGPGDAFSTAVASIVLQLPRQYLPIFQR
ncbi:MAG: prenyltransferase/squalene oxidase repeat-containing protein [Planctomycetota bacterium]